jgi:hypothetical protein
MKLLILIPILFMCGCFRVVTDAQVDILKQSTSDATAAIKYIGDTTSDEGTAFAANAVDRHLLNISAAMEIDPRDLPQPRVTVRQWTTDYRSASDATSANLKQDEYNIGTMVTVSVIATMIAGIGLKMGAQTLTATPIGGVVNFLSTLFGHSSQIKRDVYDKIIASLEAYKDIDPDWKTNKLYVLLSDKLTTPEKDFIKKERHGL